MVASSAVAIGAGDLVLGKYRIERELGAGGMGAVYAAVHVQLEQRVALKVLNVTDVARVPELGERFLREARIAARLQSEHAARVLDIGMLDSGEHCIVMEYLDGEDLGSILHHKGPLPLAEAVRHVLCACEALAEAHTHGVVHRDLKPANLFLAQRPDGSQDVKIIDFGIAGIDSQSMFGDGGGGGSGSGGAGPASGGRPLTNTRALMGTPSFMSPEQLTTPRDVDARADIWSLGVTLFELVTGERPFAASTVPGICAAILKDPPKPLLNVRPDLPPELEAIITRCLQKERAARYGDLAELAVDLAPFTPQSSRSVERISAVLARSAAANSANMVMVDSKRSSPREIEATAPAGGARAARAAAKLLSTQDDGLFEIDIEVSLATPRKPIPRVDVDDDDVSSPRGPTPTGERERFATLAGLLADLTRRPRIVINSEDLTSLALDPRTAFLLSRIGSVSSVQDLLDISGMEAGDALEILCRLLSERIIELDAANDLIPV